MTLKIYVILLAAISLITFVLYAADKRKAIKKQWRIPEATLLCFSFFGGAVGGLLAMCAVRHKTKHWYFKAVNLIGLIWQIALFIYFIKHPDLLV